MKSFYSALFCLCLANQALAVHSLPDKDKTAAPLKKHPRFQQPLPSIEPIRKLQRLVGKPLGADPIRFRMRCPKDSVALGESIEITITAELLDIAPSLFFFFEEQKSFALKVLLPSGFVQTGGNYYDFIGDRLSLGKPVSYSIVGHFVVPSDNPTFTLLRGPAQAQASSLFERKASLSLGIKTVLPSQATARVGAVAAFELTTNTTRICNINASSVRGSALLTVNGCPTNEGTRLYKQQSDGSFWGYQQNSAPYNTFVVQEGGTFVASCETGCAASNPNTRVAACPLTNAVTIALIDLGKPAISPPGPFCGGSVSIQLSCIQDAFKYQWYRSVGSASAPSTTLPNTNTKRYNTVETNPGTNYYYVSIGDADGCFSIASDPVEISINNKPSISASSTLINCGGSVLLTATGCGGGVLWSDGQTGNSVSVAPQQATTYTAQCQNGNCLGDPSNAVSINVNGLAAPSVSAANPTLCVGSSTTLTAVGCGNNSPTWSNGDVGNSITVSPLSSGTYTAYCPTQPGCPAPAGGSVSLTVTQVAAPNISSNAPNNKIAKGSSATLLAMGCNGGTVTWNDGTTGAQRDVSPPVSSTYTATCSLNGCTSGPGSIEITVTCANTLAVWEAQSNYCAEADRVYVEKDINPCSDTYNQTRNRTETCGCRPTVAPNVSGSRSICYGQSATLSASGCGSGETIEWSNGATGASIVVTPNTETAYTAVCNKNNCKSPTSASIVTITVNDQPNAPFIGGSSPAIQLGQSYTFFASGCDNGVITWNTGATGNSLTVTPSALGSFTYSATCSRGGCTSGATSTPPLVVNPNCSSLNISISASPDAAICVGASTTLTLNNCTGRVSWDNGANTASITVTPATSSTYTASCFGSSTCSATRTVLVKANETVVTANNSGTCLATSATLTATSTNGGSYSWAGPVGYSSNSQNPVVTKEGSYFLTVLYNGCPYTASTSVDFAPPRPPVLTANKTLVCLGGAAVLTATGCDLSETVLWSNGATGSSLTVSPNASSTYTARCQRSATCTSPNSNPLTINIGAFVINSNQVTLCSGESAILTADCCEGTIMWSSGQTGSSITITPATTTSYSALCLKTDNSSAKSNTLVIGVTGPLSYDGDPVATCVGNGNPPVLKSNVSVKLIGKLDALTVQYKMEKWTNGAFVLFFDWSVNANLLQNIPDGRYRLSVRGVDNPNNPEGGCNLASRELNLKCDCGFTVTATPNPVVAGELVVLAVEGLPFNAGNALNFTNTSATFESNFSQGGLSDSFTWEAWVKPSATLSNNNADERYLLYPYHGGGGSSSNDVGMGIAVGTDGIRVVEHGDGYLPQILRYDTPVTTWTHIAVVYDNKIPTLYVNGLPKATATTRDNSKTVHPSATIGGLAAAYEYGRYLGAVDEVRVWKTARKAADIAANYQRLLSGQETDLAAYWRFETAVNNQTFPTPKLGRSANLGGAYQLVLGNNNDPSSLNTVFSWTSNPAGFAEAGVFVLDDPSKNTSYTVSRSDATCRATVAVAVTPEPCLLGIAVSNNNLLPGESSVLTVSNGTFNGGKGLYFDGGSSTTVDQRLNYGNLHSNFTWEAWVWPQQPLTGNAFDNRYALFPDFFSSGHAGMGVAVGTNGIQIAEHSEGYLPLVLNHATAINGWTHVAVVYTNNAAALYLNGQLKASNASSYGGKLVHPSSRLGGEVYGHYQGKMDEVRTWNKARSAAEIQADYRRILTGNENNLSAYARFESLNNNQLLPVIPVGLVANVSGGVVLTDGFMAPKPSDGSQSFVWTSSDGSNLGGGSSLSVSPVASTTYSVSCPTCTGCNSPSQTINVLASAQNCYKITAKHSNLTLAIGDGSDGAALRQQTFVGNDSQIWKIKPGTGGTFQLLSADNGKAIENQDYSLRMWSERGNYNQRYVLSKNSDNSYRISPQNLPTAALEVSGASLGQEATLGIGSSNAAAYQQFAIETITCPFVSAQACVATGYATYER